MKYKLNLQLFAASKSASTSVTKQHTEGGSSSSTVGGSSTHSEGGSNSDTYSHSLTQAHSQGGSHADSSGIQYAAGQVEENTQNKRSQYSNDYVEGQKVQDTYNRLQQSLDNKPAFQSQYDQKLNDLYNQIINRDAFSYNFNADPMYQMYKDQYTQSGKQAMEDTMGRAQAMNGGYGSSYAQSVGQQAYQNYLQDLNNMIPTLRNQAYEEYEREGQNLLDKYNITSDAYNREYQNYRNDVADWQSDRSFDYGMYSDERNYDYNQYAQERNFWNQEYWNEKNSAYANAQTSDENNWNDSVSETNAESHTNERHWDDSTTNYWENSASSSWSDTYSQTDNNSTSFSGGGSGSGSSSSSLSKLMKSTSKESTANYEEMPFEMRARTNADIQAKYGGDVVGNIEVKDFSKNSALRDPETRMDVFTELQNVQSPMVMGTFDRIATDLNLSTNDQRLVAEWLQYTRGTGYNGKYSY